MGPVPGDGLCVYSKCSVPVKQGCFPRLLTLGGAQGPPRCALFSKVPQSALLGDILLGKVDGTNLVACILKSGLEANK